MAKPAEITCKSCGAPCGTVVFTTDYVKYLRRTMCGEIWHFPKPDVKQFGAPIDLS